MRKFKSVGQPQTFLTAPAAASNLFNLGRHLIRAEHYRNLRVSAFKNGVGRFLEVVRQVSAAEIS